MSKKKQGGERNATRNTKAQKGKKSSRMAQ